MPIKDKVSPKRMSALSIAIICLMFAAVIATTLGFALGISYDPAEVLGKMTTRSSR